MKLKAFSLLIAAVFSASSLVIATIIHVPVDQPTIQAGIDAAVDGDTVLAADGTYTGEGNRDLDFLGKAIVVMSENGAENCVIDCEEAGGGFWFHGGEDSTSVLHGFTICNADGCGIYCEDLSSPTIAFNIIRGNMSTGVVCDSSSPIIKSNTIIWNTTYFTHQGGGINCWNGSSPTIVGNTIMGNYGIWAGGGIACEGGSPAILGNLIAGNAASGLGSGGGIRCGGGSSPIITGNTITGNFAGTGGGIDCRGSEPVVTNTILWGNYWEEGGEICLADSSSLTISYSDVEGGIGSIYLGEGCTLVWGDGMIDEDPVFVLPDKKDYRLLWESPCIDAGHPDSLDADGTRSDIGAQSFDQDDYLTLYVTPDKKWARPGEQIGVTYTVINRWQSPEPCWGISRAYFPGGGFLNLIGPDQFTIPAHYTGQFLFTRNIPVTMPTDVYECWSSLFMPPSTYYDEDSFKLVMIE